MNVFRTFVLAFCILVLACPLQAQYDVPVFLRNDTLNVEEQTIYIQARRVGIVTEYWCYNGIWKWECHHNCKPPRYAKKLFRMFLDQYETKLYMLDHGIWFEP